MANCADYLLGRDVKSAFGKGGSLSLKQFLKQLEAQRVKWRLVGCGAIRTKCHECPITVFRGELAGEWNYVGKELGLSRTQRLRIVNAADKNDHPRLRAKLLKACGLA